MNTEWQKPVNYGTGKMKSVMIRSASGRIEVQAHTIYFKRKEEKGRYLLEWSVIDRWIPSGEVGYTKVAIRGAQEWSFSRAEAIKAAEAWLASRPLEAPMVGSQKAA